MYMCYFHRSLKLFQDFNNTILFQPLEGVTIIKVSFMRTREQTEYYDFKVFVDNMKTSKRNLNVCYRADKWQMKYKVKTVK